MKEKYAFLILGYCLGILTIVISTKVYPYLRKIIIEFKYGRKL